MDKIKDLLAKYKVQAAFVGGALVVSTTLGTCSFEPGAPEEAAPAEELPAEEAPEPEEPAEEEAEADE